MKRFILTPVITKRVQTMKQNNKQWIVRTVLMCLFGIMMVVYAGADIKFTTTEVTVSDGECRVRGYFTNNGDMAADLTQSEITVQIKYNGNVLYTVTKRFDMYGFHVWGGAPYHTFIIYDSRFKKEHQYTGKNPYGWYVSSYNWWNNVKP